MTSTQLTKNHSSTLKIVETKGSHSLRYLSSFLDLEISLEAPVFKALSVDSLGKRIFPPIALASNPEAKPARASRQDNRVEYRSPEADEKSAPRWVFEVSEKEIHLISNWSEESSPEPLLFECEPSVCFATLLGRLEPSDNGALVRLPAILHLPDRGSFRISSSSPEVRLSYDARRVGKGFIRVTFPGATRENPQIDYRLEIVAIHPNIPEIEGASRWDGFRRNWLNIFQINPRLGVLANHSGSDSCPFCYYKYTDIAVHTPPLAEGLSALDLIRDSLDQYLQGMAGYQMSGYIAFDLDPLIHAHVEPEHFGNISPCQRKAGPCCLDVFPSLLIASGEYFKNSHDRPWLVKNYSAIRTWAEEMLAGDTDGNGLFKYWLSGNSGSWPHKVQTNRRPSNWWDIVGFGHEDAYANALAYRALLLMAEMATALNERGDAERYKEKACCLKVAYRDAFLNPKSGVLAGWRSQDGALHDYYFLFVNGIAICNGLIENEEANAIMDRLLKKMQEVGYDRFDLGLPGNLVPIARKDYAHIEKRWGGGELEDNSDAFQIYGNGGATGCFAFFTIGALYHLNRVTEGDQIFYPMLESYDQGSFSGTDPDGMSRDWKMWDGSSCGYEGFLVDNYYALLAGVKRPLSR